MWAASLIVITIGGVTVYIAAAVCCFTKYAFLRVPRNKTSVQLAMFLGDLIACFGVMQCIRVDNGTEFEVAFTAMCT